MKKRTIAQRIYFTLGCLGLLSLMALGLMLWIEYRDNQAAKANQRRHQAVAVTAEKIRLDMLQMSDALRGMLLNPKSELERQRKLGADDALVKHCEEIKGLLADQPALLKGIDAVAEFDEKTLNRLENEVMDMIPKDAKAAAVYYETTYLPRRQEEERLLDGFLAEAEKFSHQIVEQQKQAHIYGLVAIGGVLVFAIWLARFQARAIQKVLSQNIEQLRSASAQVNEAATSITATSQSLAQGSGAQAASLEESSASLEELTSMTKRNSENAQKANDIARQMRQAADHGAGDVQTMSAAMQDIQKSSDDIAKIIKTIDEIAFQTNILALNAAVEAARAGEAGMGFAVVADEVRNLAQRSAQAAKETSAKIEGAIGNTRRGVDISSTVAQTLADIVDKARQMDELVAEVAGASREQSQGIEQINAAVGQMDHVTQGNAASAQECAASAMQLNSQSQTMRQTVNDLQQLVGGHGAEKILPSPAVARSSEIPMSAPVAKKTPSGNGHSPMPPMAMNGHGRGTIPLEDGFKNF